MQLSFSVKLCCPYPSCLSVFVLNMSVHPGMVCMCVTLVLQEAEAGGSQFRPQPHNLVTWQDCLKRNKMVGCSSVPGPWVLSPVLQKSRVFTWEAALRRRVAGCSRHAAAALGSPPALLPDLPLQSVSAPGPKSISVRFIFSLFCNSLCLIRI